MFALIHQPSLNAMQSGQAGHEKWHIEFPKTAKSVDPLTGSAGSSDMRHELSLTFDSQDAAIGYAKKNKIPYKIITRPKPIIRGKSYGENFSYERKFPWTH